jgi:hypothetical protein
VKPNEDMVISTAISYLSSCKTLESEANGCPKIAEIAISARQNT